MSSLLRIVNTGNPRQKFVKYVRDELVKYDNTFIKDKTAKDRLPVKLFLVDENNRVCGGLFADIYWHALQIITLWVHEDHRGKGYGLKLVQDAEAVARKNACTIMMVETASFNGPDFYLKAGFEITGQLENFPEGNTFYYFNKRL
jgi:ribosomal protein S18 acetylase RimI-like enzyme